VSLWGGSAEATERVARAIARVQGLLGPDAATTAVLVGGRGPGEQVRMVPWGDSRAVDAARADAPWPGRLPAPAPAMVPDKPVPLDVLDAGGKPVRVSGRGEVSAPPITVVGPHGVDHVTGWAGPWPAEERWWDTAAMRRRARLQVRCASGAAHLCLIERGKWFLEASY
jgi:protein ImuB